MGDAGLLSGLSIAEAAAAGILPVLTAVVLIVVFRRRRKDEVFTGVTPGEVPGLGHDAATARTPRSEWTGPVAVRFTPPDGMGPGVAGAVIDGRVDTRDLTATLVDLAIRGHLDIRPDGDDWRLTRTSSTEPDALDAYENAVLHAFFGDEPSVLLSHLKRPEFVATLHGAEVELYREVVAKGWYRRHPRARNSRIRLAGILLLVVSAVATVATLLAWGGGEPLWLPSLAVSGVVASLLMIRLGRGRTPRTALGSAMRIQSLGFKEYLATAEGDRMRWEEAAAVFTAYLPYAVAFGVAEHWTKEVGAVLRSAQLHLAADGAVDAVQVGADVLLNSPDLVLHTLDGLGNLVDLVPGELPDVGGLLDLPDVDLGGLGDGLGDALGSLTDGIGDLVPGDGCLDGCDGCDALGCLDF